MTQYERERERKIVRRRYIVNETEKGWEIVTQREGERKRERRRERERERERER